MMGPSLGLRSLGAATRGLIAKALLAPLLLIGGAAGAFIASDVGAAYGLAAAPGWASRRHDGSFAKLLATTTTGLISRRTSFRPKARTESW